MQTSTVTEETTIPEENDIFGEEMTRNRSEFRQRLLHRFYEPLGLLYALGKARDEHTHKNVPSPENVDSLTSRELRRHFLEELAFLCDHEKGGDTCTAIGLAETPQGYTFWVAANKCPKKRIAPFLTRLLKRLSVAALGGGGHDLTQEIFKLGVDFANERLSTYVRYLQRDLGKLKKLSTSNDTRIRADFIAVWEDKLNSCEDEDFHSLVSFAYANRHSDFVRQLNEVAQAHEQHYNSGIGGLQEICKSFRHYVGRLGLHARSAELLALYTPRVKRFLDFYRVEVVPVHTRSLRPPARNATTPEKALGRMMPKADAPELEEYRQSLAHMDGPFNISKRFLEEYREWHPRGIVHAEVQVLHHLHQEEEEGERAVFVDDDKYVACSKPACFCCLLYFRHHPGGFVEPRSHHKIYLSWQPPGVGGRSTRAGEVERQEKILDRMIADIRRDALRQIKGRIAPRFVHPDSVTGISTSMRFVQKLDCTSTIAEDERKIEEFTSLSSDYSSSGTDDAVFISSETESFTTDSDVDDEDGGVVLQLKDCVFF